MFLKRLAVVAVVAVVAAVAPRPACAQSSALPPDADKRLVWRLGEDFTILESDHFLVYYNTSEEFARHRRMLFEKLHDVYSESFEKIGMALRENAPRLTVVLLDTEPQFRKFVGEPNMTGVAGLYFLDDNRIVFYDANTDATYRSNKAQISSVTAQLSALLRQARSVRNRADKLRIRRVVGGLRKELRECEEAMDGVIANQNVAVTIHEASHALSFNLGPFRLGEDLPPRWLAEGLATFFETPRVGQWRGAARFNADRFLAYKAARDAVKLPTLREILTNQNILLEARTIEAAYGAAWSLFYFLYHEHPDACGEILSTFREPLEIEDRDAYSNQVVADFERIMERSLEQVRVEWHDYMDACEEKFAADIEGWERAQDF